MIDNFHNPNENWIPKDYDRLTPEERERLAWLHVKCGCGSLLLLGLIIMLAVALLTGCTTTRFVEVERVSRDTVRQVSQVHDSIYIHDSVNVSQYRQGDTLYVCQTRWRDRWHVQTQTDTVRTARVDSIPQPYPVEVVREVEKPLTAWQTFRLHLANVVLIALGLLIAVWVWRTK